MITLEHRIKTHVLGVKVSKEFIAVVSNVMKHHFSVYSIFAKDITVYKVESNLNALHKEMATFLNAFKNCILDSLLGDLHPERPTNHIID